ncbi:MAG TPA: amidohydrolase family protein [Candidatus Acidoferrales bacterium]|nr:amidohydrolase family protein [Candidatus Acidoferrales bacterium]
MKRRNFLAGAAAIGGAALLGNPALSAEPQPSRFKYKKPVIDAHVHWYPPELAELVEKEGAEGGLTNIHRNSKGEVVATQPGYHPYNNNTITFRHEMTDVDLILKAMDDRDVNMSTLTQTNPHVVWAEPAFGIKMAQTVNNATSALCAKYPQRFTAAITLPMQDVKASIAELERCKNMPGMRAANFPENILGKNLGDPSLWPVYEKCQALNLPIFLHNVDPISERLVEKNITMMNLLGNPFEATIAATSLVLNGVMDEFPTLDIFFPHAGGFFAFVTPRIDWAMAKAPAVIRNGPNGYNGLKLPRASDYRRRFYYDLILHDPQIQRMLIDLVGVDRVVCGTDFPQAMAIMKPVEYVERIPGITQREAEIILCENPARLLRLQ